MVRVLTLLFVIIFIIITILGGMSSNDPLLMYSAIMPAHAVIILFVGWFFYKKPHGSKTSNELVSVIIPVYNQRHMIEGVIDAILGSTYERLQVIAVDDGSQDGTKEILDSLALRYPALRVVHKKNGGKRRAVATGFGLSEGKYLVLLDSDSIVERNAITELIRVLDNNPKIGGAVGHVKVWNASKNILTRCQDTWYDYAFNIHKACESYFGSVTCCSGCLAVYRYSVLKDFIPYWKESTMNNSDDRELTSYVIAAGFGKNGLSQALAPEKFSSKLEKSAASYDDAEDRVLTAQSLEKWKTVYVPTAIVYTDVPESFRSFVKQQERWKKGYLRTNFYVSTFFWHKRNPLMSLIFYLEFMSTFSAPLIAFVILFFEPFIMHQYWYSLLLIGGLSVKGFAVGLDYRFRDPAARNWMYKPLMNALSNFVLSWVLFIALWNYRKNKWMTR